MLTRCLPSGRIVGLACCGALLAGAVGCGGSVVSPEESMPLRRHSYRRFSGAGGPSRIYDAAKHALGKMGALVTGERPGESLHGRLDIARQPVHLYLKIARGNRVYVTVYNMKKKAADEWRLKLYEAMNVALKGAPSERPRGGRGGRSGRRG